MAGNPVQTDLFATPTPLNLLTPTGELWLRLFSLQWQTAARYWEGLGSYSSGFVTPLMNAAAIFARREQRKWIKSPRWGSFHDYLSLLSVNAELAARCMNGSLDAVVSFHGKRWPQWMDAWTHGIDIDNGRGVEKLLRLSQRQFALMDAVSRHFPEAIHDIRDEFGFHFEDGGYRLISETDRFRLIQVLPNRRSVTVRNDAKPILIIPPSVLGPNIMAFLPAENRSFVHAFANQGFPTFIRIAKSISMHPAVQTMTGEDDASDTRTFCETILKSHGRPATLCGYCQGGFMAMLTLLSGELDGLADALMTCVSPMDGSRSKDLVAFIHLLPERFRNLGYAVKELPNGNRVVDGGIMSWVYKLKSIEFEGPVTAFYRDLEMLDRFDPPEKGFSKSALAINHWLLYDQVDLPEAVTRLSFESYRRPVSDDGTLPVRLFGRQLNFKRIRDRKIPYLICYAEKDNLVDPSSALAPMDFIDVELSSYPRGHVAIATSNLDPGAGDGAYVCTNTGCAGPVEFQLRLDAETAGRDQ
ncbi:MAG: metal transporter [Desulfobacterales bacterium]|jgi:hypothetical protein